MRYVLCPGGSLFFCQVDYTKASGALGACIQIGPSAYNDLRATQGHLGPAETQGSQVQRA